MRFAKWTFLVAGIYGLIVLLPMYFLEERISRDNPPEITHPEYFYGFVGVGAAWQVVFLIIATDPARYRPLMLASVLEKASYGGAVVLLYLQGRVAPFVLATAVPDLLLGVLFLTAWFRTPAFDKPLPAS